MTISSPTRTAGPFAGNGVTTVFPFAFKIFQASDLQLVRTDSVTSLPTTLILTSDYIVSMNADQNAAPGGSIMLNVALATGLTLVMTSSLPYLQATDLTNGGGFYPAVITAALDRLTIFCQQLFGLTSRALRVPVSDIAIGTELPSAVARANNLLGFDASGNPIAVAPNAQSATALQTVLAAPSGSSTLGFYGTNVQDQLNANIAELGVHAGEIATNTTGIATNVTAIAANKSDLAGVRNTIVGTNLAPLVVDLHFGTLCGTGWLGDSTELGGYTPTPTTASVATSPLGTAISVVDPTLFRVGQLICYLAPSLTWYPANVRSIAGSVLQLDRQLPEGISLGASVIYFYATDAHPNEYGYMTIVDDALRQLTKKEQIAYVGRNYEIWSAVAAATVTATTLGAISAASYLIPGATINADRAALVTCTAAGDGATSDWVALAAGSYNTHLVLNSGERTGALSGDVQVSIDELRTDGNIYGIATVEVAGFSGARAIDVTYKTSPGSAVRARVVSNSGGGATFYLGKLTHGKIVEHPASLNHGTHVLLGDSWFASGFLMTHLQARLPLATFINAGVSGNRASQLLTRFGTDVAPTGANFVWVMCGTNDYYADVTASLFEQQINQVTGLIQGIGAQPINWTASVGDALYAVAPYERLTVSRQYAAEVNYHAHTASPNGIGAKYRSANLSANAVSIPAGGSVVLGVTPGKTYLQAFLKNLFTSAGGLNIWVGYASIIDTTTLVDQSTFASAAEIKNTILTRADTAPRYVVVVAYNPSGSPIVTSMVADIAWVQA